MEGHIIFEVEVADVEQLKSSLGIPEDDIYIDLAPDVQVSLLDEQIRRGGFDILPYLLTFVITVSGQLTAEAISALVKRIHEGGGEKITIVKRHTVNISIEQKETLEKIQKLLTEKDDDVK